MFTNHIALVVICLYRDIFPTQEHQNDRLVSTIRRSQVFQYFLLLLLHNAKQARNFEIFSFRRYVLMK